MSGFNLSAIAVRERAVTLFLLLAIMLAGVVAFLTLGRAEDPAFTIKQMTVVTAWPGHRTGNGETGRRAAGEADAGTPLV
jgi:multidrug efflux pump subunit AcrB